LPFFSDFFHQNADIFSSKREHRHYIPMKLAKPR
jgi:hypothetical protein